MKHEIGKKNRGGRKKPQHGPRPKTLEEAKKRAREEERVRFYWTSRDGWRPGERKFYHYLRRRSSERMCFTCIYNNKFYHKDDNGKVLLTECNRWGLEALKLVSIYGACKEFTPTPGKLLWAEARYKEKAAFDRCCFCKHFISGGEKTFDVCCHQHDKKVDKRNICRFFEFAELEDSDANPDPDPYVPW